MIGPADFLPDQQAASVGVERADRLGRGAAGQAAANQKVFHVWNVHTFNRLLSRRLRAPSISLPLLYRPITPQVHHQNFPWKLCLRGSGLADD